MKAEIEVVKGAPRQKRIIEAGRPLTIGRSQAADLRIQSGVVSRLHCQIEHDGRSWVLTDLDSRNGTWALGDPVKNRTLVDGDVFTLGKRVALRFGLLESTAKIPASPPPPMMAGAEDADCPFCIAGIARNEAAVIGPEGVRYHRGCFALSSVVGADLGGTRVIERLPGPGPVHRFRGHQPALNRRVVLVAFDESVAGGESFRDRLLSEVRGVSQLLHPNLIQIFDFLEHKGAYLVSMEQFNGETLEEILLKRRFVNVPAALAISSQVADALALAEGQGQVTDRLSPGKIFVNQENNVKVDFFRAPMARAVTPAEIPYIAPEALKGTGLRTGADRPTDLDTAAKSGVYTLGAIIYHMLAGIPPFEGATAEEVLPKIMRETPPPLRRVNLKVSPALARVVERAMDKDPGNRPPNFRLFEADLRKIIAPVL